MAHGPTDTGIPVTGVSELVLEVKDIVVAERFYAETLGLPVVERYASGESVWLLAGNRTRIGLWLPQLGVAGGRGGTHVHFALHLEDEDFDGAVERLRSQGLDPQVESRRKRTALATRSAYVMDPDGHCVELWTEDIGRYAARVGAGERRDSWWSRTSVAAHTARARVTRVGAMLGDGPGELLEVECGSGQRLGELIAQGWSVTAVERDPELLDVARARLPDAAERLSQRVGGELRLPGGSFDVVLAHRLLESRDRDRLLEEVVRVLRPGGRALIGLRNAQTPTTLWQRQVVHRLARAGKRVVRFGRRPPHPYPTLSVRRARRLIAASGLVVDGVERASCVVLPDPLDRVFPGLAYRLASRAEGKASLRGVFGTQLLVSARKPG